MGSLAKKGFMSQFRPLQDIGQVGHALGQMGAKPNSNVPLPPPAAHPQTMATGANVLKAKNSTNGAGAAYYGNTISAGGNQLQKAGGAKGTLLGS